MGRNQSNIDVTVRTSIKPFKYFLNLDNNKKFAFDFDGVLCEECPSDKKGNDIIYEEFLKNVDPLFFPVHRDIVIITGRHEKYRKLTTKWLALHGVIYSQLIMRDFELQEGTSWVPALSEHKAKHCLELGLDFFVESRYPQAVLIANQAKIPVLCTSPFEIILPQHTEDEAHE
jgi:uncharacterized HAD superfamily protein